MSACSLTLRLCSFAFFAKNRFENIEATAKNLPPIPSFPHLLPTFALPNREAEISRYCPNGPLSVLPVQSRQQGIILKAHSNAKGKNELKCQKKV